MTESEWMTAVRPWPLWEFLSGMDLLTERKRRLFVLAACRRVEHLLTDDRIRALIELSERYADGLVSVDALLTARPAAFTSVWSDEVEAYEMPAASWLAGCAVRWLGTDTSALGRAVELCTEVFGVLAIVRAGLVAPTHPIYGLAGSALPEYEAGRQAEESVQADFLRDLFGYPYRLPKPTRPSATTVAVGMAERIYDEHAYDRMPILADALEDTGYDDADVLSHCRGDGPHVRGCWVVDLILGKS